MSHAALFTIGLLASLLVSFPLVSSSGAAAQREGPLRWAYYVPEDPASLASLRQRAGDLDYVGLHWASMREDGSVEVKANQEALQLARSVGARPILSIWAGSVEAVHTLLASEVTRAAAVESLARATADYEGLSIDFEGLPPEDRDRFTAFMAQLAGRLRPAGKLVTMALSAKTSDTRTGWAGALDYAALAPHADLFVVMAYGFRTARNTDPGSPAPISWVESSLAFAVSQIPPRKVLLGVPFYGYDWNVTTGPPARALRHPDAIALADQYGATVEHDLAQQSARFRYAKEGHNHEVWFENRAALDAKLALMRRYGAAGVAGWRLGHEDPEVWQAIRDLSSVGASSATPVATPSGVATVTPVATPSGVPTVAPVAAPSGVPTVTPATRPGAVASGASGGPWFFAEGSTSPPFDTWFLLQNPRPVPANVRLSFMLEGGRTVERSLLMGPTSRTSLFANQVIPNAAFSARVESDQPIHAERAMYVGFDGHDVTAATAASRTWYFADGATTTPFHTWILLQNPNPAPASARVLFQQEDGTTVVQPMFLAPNSRASLFANQVIPNAAFATRVEADQPLVAERAMYRFPGNAATGVVGAPAPARAWFFAGGLTTFRGGPADTWLLLANPNPSPVAATITLLGSEGQTATLQRLLGPNSRQSLFVNQVFKAPSFGIRVEASGEIVAEKSVFLGPAGTSGGEPQGATATLGAPQLGTAWALPEGSTAAPFSEWISVLNPHAGPMPVRFEFMLESGQVVAHEATIGPARTFDLDVATVVRSAGISARVTTGLPSAVERAMFWIKEGKTGAHGTMGIRLE